MPGIRSSNLLRGQAPSSAFLKRSRVGAVLRANLQPERMRLGLMVALFLAAQVWSCSEARTVSRCELKRELGRLLVLPPELERLREKILSRVICRLERETQLDTERLQVSEPTPRSVIGTSNPAHVHRRKRDVEFFEEELRKLQAEVDTVKPEDEESTVRVSQASNVRSSADTKVIDKLDQGEMNPQRGDGLTYEELKSILTNVKDDQVKSGGEGMLRLKEDMRDMEDEVDRRVVDQLDRDEMEAVQDTQDSKDPTLIFEELERFLNQDTGETDTMEDAPKPEEDVRAEVEKRVIDKLDRDEVDASEDKDSNLTIEDYLEGNEIHKDDAQEETDGRVIDELDQDETEAHVSQDKEDTHTENSRGTAEGEERTMISSVDRDETVEDTPEDETSTKGEEAGGMATNDMDGDEMNEVQGDKEKETDWEDKDIKARHPNLTFDELVSVVVEKIKAARDRLVDDKDVTDERNPEVDMSSVRTGLDEEDRRVISELDQDETPQDKKEVSNREQELMRHLDQEMKSGEDAAGVQGDGDQMDTGEDNSNDKRAGSTEVDVRTINKLDQDERNSVEDMDRNEELEVAVRRWVKELEQDKRNTSNMGDNQRRILGQLRRILNKMDQDTGEVAPKDKRDTSMEMDQDTTSAEVDSVADQDTLVDMLGQLDKVLLTEQDDNDTLVNKDLGEDPDVLDDLLSGLDHAVDMNSGERRKRSLSPGRGLVRHFGLLQLSDRLTCDSGSSRSRNVCDTNCTAFVDDDIRDDLACFVRIKAWARLLRPQCPTDQDFFRDCP